MVNEHIRCSLKIFFIMPQKRKMKLMVKFLVNVITFFLLDGSLYVKGQEYALFQDNNSIECKLSDQTKEYIQCMVYGKEGLSFTNVENISQNYCVFACHQYDHKSLINYTCHDIFIALSIQDKNTNKAEIFTGTKLLEEHENTTISCHFNRANLDYVLFWIVVYPNCSNQCLASVELDNETYNSTLKKLCNDSRRNVNDKSKSFGEPTHQYELEIKDLKPSDSGRYLCIIHILSKGQGEWKLATNMSLTVNKINSSAKGGQNKFIYVRAGTVGGIIILIAIILLTVCCIKSKGKQMESRPRQSDAVDHPDNDTCTPYAVSNRADLEEDPGTLYSIVQKPEQKPDPGTCVAYSVLELQHH